MEKEIPILKSAVPVKEPPAALKKLKWGLGDLSTLFGSTVPAAEPAPLRPVTVGFDIQFAAVCVPDEEGEALHANSVLAAELARAASVSVPLVSIVPGMNTLRSRKPASFSASEIFHPRIVPVSLSHQSLWSLTRNPHASFAPGPEARETQSLLCLLVFEPSQFHSLARIALLLDRVIFFVPPKVEGLREGYRWAKIFWSLNREIEPLLLFQRDPAQIGREAYFFEKFSLITSRFLGISTGWMGSLPFPEKSNGMPQTAEPQKKFYLEPLLAAEGLKRPLAPEKLRLWHYVREACRHHTSHAGK